MKRRVFLTTTGAIGLAGAASGATVVSSVYTSMSTKASLKEFTASNKTILDHFIEELTLNTQAHDLDKKHIAAIALPVRIIKKDKQRIVYKNKAGDYITLSVKNGVETILVKDAL